ncbi:MULTISPECIES: tripartite tricarboxylate transporter substrate binding protein [unclassified Beijerinckia]|uniref:Bug family tripartite tricarboxylate transporter substrate binding protein n=1 Tax=unclassified Beijerinckia TaxID=2638183 RepID=UPI00089474B6|nr:MULTISPECIES: tripartite tricarboxylate transporter substrate binding protein [unclassified Beijerinckia]MDH7795821.1 tripartite-type tricarboxylate transporter receptor subunit TctC [Beijerinckia sp. GAS462]SEC17827.1 Tripartite-type tricarboxylate transporter, receptor component TctC [Beijerinckia sp. 28-YEA-48]
MTTLKGLLRPLSATIFATLLLLPPNGAKAQAPAYPSDNVHFICGFAAGSGADIIVRFFANKMQAILGKTVIVENKPGAIGNIATEYVARAKPDGYTVYVTSGDALATNMHIFKTPTVDVIKQLQIVTTINRMPMMIAVSISSPYKTVDELTKAMKEKGDKASYATTNPPARVVGAMYKTTGGLSSVEIQYKTTADTLNDVTSGAVDYAIYDPVFATIQARQGKIRILAVATGERLKSAPEYPTMTELGYKMNLVSWWGAMVPTGTPQPIVEKLRDGFAQIIASEDGKKFLGSIASDPWIIGSEEAQQYWRKEVDDWREYVRLAKIEPQG